MSATLFPCWCLPHRNSFSCQLFHENLSDPAAESMSGAPEAAPLVCLQIPSGLCRSWRPVRLDRRKGSKVMQRNCSTSSRVTCSRPCWVSSVTTATQHLSQVFAVCPCSSVRVQVWSRTRTWFCCLSSDFIIQTEAERDRVLTT